MCDGDAWRRLDADFAKIIGSLEIVAASPREEVEPAAAQGLGESSPSRAHNAGCKCGVVVWVDWESSRAGVAGAGPTRLPDDESEPRLEVQSRKPGEAARHSIARRAIP